MPTMLITGAAGAIGAATSRAAARAGWDVALNSRRARSRADEVAASIRAETGQRAVVVLGDVSVETDVVAMFDEVIGTFGTLDCLVNNAGIAPGHGPFVDLKVEDIEQVWAVNLTGAFLCAREAVRRMARSQGGNGGSIVNVSSKAAVLGGSSEWIHYAASKGGLDTLTTGLAKEVAVEGIRVNSVRLGLIAGDFGPWAPEGRTERVVATVPMGRAAEPEEIAATIVWLASNDASYVTGSHLDVAGGR
jgi:NAD(P)-dependent dehydrogenase (short-subunit alcohol dehydrogenase family)